MEVRTKKITPDCFGEKYKGTITVRRLKRDELDVIRDELGLLDIDPKAERTNKEDYKFMLKVYEKAKNYILAAEVERVADGEKLDLEALEYETELTELNAELASSLLAGWAMGNEKRQQQG